MQLTGPSRLRALGQGQTRLRPTSSRTGHRLVPARTGVVLHAEPNNLGDVELLDYAELIKEIEERKKQQAELLTKLDDLVVEHGIQPDSAAVRPPSASSQPQQASSTGRLQPPPPPAQRRPQSPRPLSDTQPQQQQQQQQARQQQQQKQQQQQPQQPSTWAAAPAPAPAPMPQPASAPQQPASLPQQPAIQAADAAAPAPPPAPPLAGENVMNIVMVGAECAPWSKTGGLGDVMGALPKALARRGHRVMVIAPRYSNYEDAWETGVRHMMRVANTDVEVGYFHAYRDGVDFVFVDHPAFHVGSDIYGGGREALQFRCTLLCKAALEAVWHVAPGGVPYGDNNTVYIANDWHTALLPVYLQAHYRDYGQMTYARAVFVIHNMAHQGRAPFVESASLELPEHYREQLRLYDPIGGEHMNIMKAGLQNSHRIVAVSDGYAWECQTQEGGWGLDGIVRDNNWKLRGIVNGIDYKEWSPMNDPHLTSDGYTQYDLATLQEGKARCKAALQRELGLPVNPDAPLLGFIGRLDYQKGVDLIRDSFDWIIGQGCQMILLGSGREDLEGDLRAMEGRRRDSCRAWVGFSVQMAHRITAGCDILLMPSRFEPCGLNQLYAMAYGTVPVVHAVGGLRDTVKPYDPHSDSGTGWTFERAEQSQMNNAIHNALYTYREHRPAFERLQRRGMDQDLSWDHAAELYEQVLVAAKYQW